MIGIIFSIAIVAIVLVVFFYVKGKGKKVNEKSSSEKISDVVVSKFRRGMKDFAHNIRDIEWLRNEAISKLNEAKDKLENDYRQYLTNLLTTRESLKSLISTTDVRVKDLMEKSRRYKKRYEESNNEVDRQYSEKYISHIISLNKNKSTLDEKLSLVLNKINDAEGLYEYQLSLLELKRVDVLTMTCMPDMTTAAKLIDVDGIIEEFKDKIKEENINTEVDSMMNPVKDSKDDIMNVSSEEIKAFYDTL